MRGKELKVHAKHFQERVFDRKFVSSAWSVLIDGKIWWVVVGLHDTIETIIDVNEGKRGYGESIVESGEFYDFVEEVNRRLMKDTVTDHIE